MYARYYAVECLCSLFIVLCSRQTNDFGVVIHSVSMLVHYDIECLSSFAFRYKHLSRPAVIVSFNLRCSSLCIEQIIFFKCLLKSFIILLFAVLIFAEGLHSLVYFVKSNRLAAALVLFFCLFGWFRLFISRLIAFAVNIAQPWFLRGQSWICSFYRHNHSVFISFYFTHFGNLLSVVISCLT